MKKKTVVPVAGIRYVDARYKEDFVVSGAEIGVLTERIRRLLDIAERICKNRLLNLEKRRRRCKKEDRL